MAAEEGQQHPLKIYYVMWVALFVLSGVSYWTDFWDDGPFRTTAILTLMMVKAGGIVWIFMHMGWERMALKLAILGPPVCTSKKHASRTLARARSCRPKYIMVVSMPKKKNTRRERALGGTFRSVSQ